MLNKDELKYLDNGIYNLDVLIKDLKNKLIRPKEYVIKELEYILSNFTYVKSIQKSYKGNKSKIVVK